MGRPDSFYKTLEILKFQGNKDAQKLSITIQHELIKVQKNEGLYYLNLVTVFYCSTVTVQSHYTSHMHYTSRVVHACFSVECGLLTCLSLICYIILIYCSYSLLQ